MQNGSLGTLVFPTHRSDIILGNPSLLHYGTYNRSVSGKSYNPEEQNQNFKNSSNPVEDNLDNYHPSNIIFTNSTRKLSESMESNQQYSNSGMDKQQRTRNDEMMEQEKSLIIETGNQSTKSNESEMTENESVERKLSISSKKSELSKSSEINNTSISSNCSSEIYENSYTSNVQQSNSIYNSKSLSPNSVSVIQAKQKLIEPIIQQRSLTAMEQCMSSFYPLEFIIITKIFLLNKLFMII